MLMDTFMFAVSGGLYKGKPHVNDVGEQRQISEHLVGVSSF